MAHMIVHLNELLKNKEKTAYWLHKETGISQQHLGALKKNATKSIRFDSICKICVALDCTVGDLLEVKK